MLLKASEGRGIDTRFARDSIVLIIALVNTTHQLQQMIGRSSRTRGVCECILYLAGDEKQNQVMARLSRQNIAAMQDLEQLLKLIEKRDKSE